MIQINITQNIEKSIRKRVRKWEGNLAYAASRAINDTLKDARKANEVQIPQKLDRPTRFTEKAFALKFSHKRNLTGFIIIKPKQWEYLKYAVMGGTRKTAGKGTGVPVNARLNKHGNIPGRRKGLVKGKKQFVAEISGIHGVWQRVGGKRSRRLKLMVSFEKDPKYEKRFPYRKIVKGVVDNRFSKHFSKRYREAQRSSR